MLWEIVDWIYFPEDRRTVAVTCEYCNELWDFIKKSQEFISRNLIHGVNRRGRKKFAGGRQH
jgi:hypothetical protein